MNVRVSNSWSKLGNYNDLHDAIEEQMAEVKGVTRINYLKLNLCLTAPKGATSVD